MARSTQRRRNRHSSRPARRHREMGIIDGVGLNAGRARERDAADERSAPPGPPCAAPNAVVVRTVARASGFQVRALDSVCATVLTGAFCLSASSAHALPPGALWKVVRSCVLDDRITGLPWPCLAVDRRDKVVVVADPNRRTQVLLTPATRVVGIESSELFAPGAPRFWRAAWEARRWLERRARLRIADEDIGLAVNSVPGRTQDQLHIHIDCLRGSVRRTIDHELASVGETWAWLPSALINDHRYRGRWLTSKALQTTDPFRLLSEDPEVGGDRGAWTLAMVVAMRASGEQGFVVLSHRAALAHGDLATGEELLDHRCKVLRPVSALSQTHAGGGRADMSSPTTLDATISRSGGLDRRRLKPRARPG